jgi:hypothetical protein
VNPNHGQEGGVGNLKKQLEEYLCFLILGIDIENIYRLD